MKTTLMTLVSLSFSVLLAGACTSEVTSTDPGSGLSLLSNGPDLPEECNPCWDAFQQCFADGNGTEDCAQDIIECVDACQAPPPPAECLHCAAGFEACATTDQDNGGTGEDCAVGFEGCLAACEGQSQCDEDPDSCNQEPPIDECHACDLGFDECVNDQWGDEAGENQDPSDGAQGCEDQWQQCHQSCEGGDDGNDDDDFCQWAKDVCEGDGSEVGQDGAQTPDGENINCQEVLEQCDEDTGVEPEPEPNDCSWCADAQQQCEGEGGQDGQECEDLTYYCAQVCP